MKLNRVLGQNILVLCGLAMVMVTGCASTDHRKGHFKAMKAPKGAEFIVVEDESKPDSKKDFRMVAKMDEVEDYTLDN